MHRVRCYFKGKVLFLLKIVSGEEEFSFPVHSVLSTGRKNSRIHLRLCQYQNLKVLILDLQESGYLKGYWNVATSSVHWKV